MRSPSAVHTQLTDIRVAKLNNFEAQSDLFARDTNLQGFGLRVSPRNVKSFFVEATVRGRFIRRVLGRYPLLSVAEARKRALEALQAIKYGVAESEAAQASVRTPMTFSALATDFVTRKKQVLRASTIADYRMVLEGVYFDAWKRLPVQQITRRAVLDQYTALTSMHGVGMANKAMRVVSAVFNYGRAVDPDLESWANPIAVLTEARARLPLRPRTGHIPPDRLPDWLAALDAYRDRCPPNEDPARRHDIWLLLHLLLMTGLRSNEARSLRWRDVDLDNETFVITKEIAKNHREVRLPLNHWLVDQLSKRPRSANGYVFEASCAEGYINNLRRPLKQIATGSGLRITPHDLRRSFATYLDLLRVPFGAIKQLLNHVSTLDVTSRYVQQRGIDELRRYSEKAYKLIEAASARP